MLSQAAELAPDGMNARVYACAMMLPDGMSRAAFKVLDVPNPDFEVIITQVHDGAGTIVDPVRGRAVFAQLSPPDRVDAAILLAAQRRHDIGRVIQQRLQ